MELSVGLEIPSLRKVATREEIAAYAHSSGDTNPLHLDDEVARAAGFDGVIAHGMFTMAHLTTCLTNWLGDPSVLKRLRVSFRAAVRPGDEMVAGGRVVRFDPVLGRAGLEVWVSVERDGVTAWPIKRGEAEVEFPISTPTGP